MAATLNLHIEALRQPVILVFLLWLYELRIFLYITLQGRSKGKIRGGRNPQNLETREWYCRELKG